MAKRYGYLLAIIIIAAAFLAVLFFGASRPKLPAPSPNSATHVYKNPYVSIAHVRVKALYALPANRKSEIDPVWKEEFSVALEDAKQFHELQFRGLSKFDYDIFPQPVLLERDDVFYDTNSTGEGNPHALINVGEEIDRRVLGSGGDLYNAAFVAMNPHDYDVMAILYEGVGASGGVIYDTQYQSASEIAQRLSIPESIIYIVNIKSVSGFFILNRNFLAKDSLKASGESVFYHEFAHTIGLPDLFDQNDAPLSNDIMGEGRKKPIKDTYIDKSSLKDMGVF